MLSINPRTLQLFTKIFSFSYKKFCFYGYFDMLFAHPGEGRVKYTPSRHRAPPQFFPGGTF